MKPTHLIIGLGNPGKTYVRTRHNVGFRILDALVPAFTFDKKGMAECFADGTTLYCKPQTFMNASGDAVAVIGKRYAIPATRVLVIYDDNDLPFGTIRPRTSGSSAGHRGMQSIIDALHTSAIPRIRIGIGHTRVGDTRTHVLSRFHRCEERALPHIFDEVARLIQMFRSKGLPNTSIHI